MSEAGLFANAQPVSFSDIFPEKDTLVTKVVGIIETAPRVRVAELYQNDNERRKVSNILTVLKFLNMITFSGKSKDKIVTLNSHNRLLTPVPLNQIMQEISLAAQNCTPPK